jgi:hypothetical protein
MYNALNEIARKNGREGLLPHNLPDGILNQLLNSFIKITRIIAHYPDFFDDDDIVHELRDEIQSIALLIKLFTLNESPSKEVFDKTFRSLRYYYWVEKYGRAHNMHIVLPNVDTILNHPA